jgi:hypothetical protein
MYTLISQILFWCYWLIALITGALLVRAVVKGADWKVQASAALAVIPFILRVLLIK